ncbi:MAG: hypothetical protein Q9175_003947, partial [Cornicularia normoerica]
RTFHAFIQLPQLPPKLPIEIYGLAFLDHRDRQEGREVGRPVGWMPLKSQPRSGKSIRPFSKDVRENQHALEGKSILAIPFTFGRVYLEAAPA